MFLWWSCFGGGRGGQRPGLIFVSLLFFCVSKTIKLSIWFIHCGLYEKKQICNNHLTNHKKHSHLVLEFGSLLTEEDENKGGFDPPSTIQEDLFGWWWKLFIFTFLFLTFTFYFDPPSTTQEDLFRWWWKLFNFYFYFLFLTFTFYLGPLSTIQEDLLGWKLFTILKCFAPKEALGNAHFQ